MGKKVTKKHSPGEQDDQQALAALLNQAVRKTLAVPVFPDSSKDPLPGALVPDRARIFIIQDGYRDMAVSVQGKVQTVRLQPGHALFLGKHTWHVEVLQAACRYLLVIIEQDHINVTYKHRDSDGGYTRLEYSYILNGPLTPAAVHVLQALEELTGRGAVPEGVPKALVTALVSLVVQALGERPHMDGKARNTRLALLAYLQEHYREPINRESVAAVFGLHPNHVSRIFRHDGGEGFNRMLTRLRLGHAARVLRDNRVTVKEAAVLCGFSDVNYFSKVFRKYYGMAPGRYRI